MGLAERRGVGRVRTEIVSRLVFPENMGKTLRLAPGTGRHACPASLNGPHDTNQRRKGATTLTYLPGGISRVNTGT